MDLRTRILDQLVRSQRIVRDRVEVVPRFTVLAPDDEHVALVQLPGDPQERIARLDVMRAFMVWKAAHGFLLASELAQPQALLALAITRDGAEAGIQPFIRNGAVKFLAVRWYGRDGIDPLLLDLLPPKSMAVTRQAIDFMDAAFAKETIDGIHWIKP